MKNLVVFLALVLFTALAVACGSGSGDGVQEVELTASDIEYDKTNFEVVAGRPVRLVLHNEGVLEHDFSIMHIPMHEEPVASSEGSEEHMMEMEHMEEEPELHVAVMAGMDSTVEFTPTEAGDYEFYCTVPGHKEAGMRGTLVVREP